MIIPESIVFNMLSIGRRTLDYADPQHIQMLEVNISLCNIPHAKGSSYYVSPMTGGCCIERKELEG